MPNRARLYIAYVIALGLVALSAGITQWRSEDPLRFSVYLVLAVIASTLKVRLPGMAGTYSMSFLFLLIGVADLSYAEIVAIAAATAAMQCLWRPKKMPSAAQVLFNVSNLSLSITAAHFSYRAVSAWTGNLPILLALAASVYFVVNTLLVSGAISLVESRPFRKTWEDWLLSSFPYYLVGAAAAGVMVSAARHTDWRIELVTLPLMCLVHLYYRLQIEGRSSGQTL